MPNTLSTFHLRPLRGAQSITSIFAFLEAMSKKQTYSLLIATQIPTHTVSKSGTSDSLKQESELKDFKQSLEDRPNLLLKRFQVGIAWKPKGSGRGGDERLSINYDLADGIVANITIDSDHVSNCPIQPIAIVDALQGAFDIVPKDEILFEGLPKPVQNQVQYQETVFHTLADSLAKLETLAARQVEQNAEHVRRLTDELQKKYEEREQQLADKATRQHEDLQRREEEFREKLAEFETRESRYVRRDLLTQIRNQLNETKSISLSEGTNIKRKPIHIACVGALGLGLALLLIGITEAAVRDNVQWYHFAPFTAGAILFGSTLVYYLRWANRWFSDHADAEFKNMQFSKDMLRTSWLAELVFEGKEESGKVLPDKLVDRFSHGLFVDSRGEFVGHPSEDVERLLRRVSRLKVGRGLLEIEKNTDGHGRRTE